mgnify:CR=1 FL=1
MRVWYSVGMKSVEEIDGKTVIIFILGFLLVIELFGSSYDLPEGCYLYPSVDVGGSEVVCD